MAVGIDVRRANQLIYNQIGALGAFTGDSDAWYGWQKNFRRSTREFHNDLKYRVFRLMCWGLAERRLEEALSAHPVPDGGDPYQPEVDILNGIHVDEDQKDHEIVVFCKLIRSLVNQFILLSPWFLPIITQVASKKWKTCRRLWIQIPWPCGTTGFISHRIPTMGDCNFVSSSLHFISHATFNDRRQESKELRKLRYRKCGVSGVALTAWEVQFAGFSRFLSKNGTCHRPYHEVVLISY